VRVFGEKFSFWQAVAAVFIVAFFTVGLLFGPDAGEALLNWPIGLFFGIFGVRYPP